MNEYVPDIWVVLKVAENPDDIHYRVLGGWYGGYLGSDSWRLNSGITSHEFDGDYWKFYGSSGSCYKCHQDSYRMNVVTGNVYSSLREKWKVALLDDKEWTKDGWSWNIG
jgi:hypothetical protein